MNNNTRNKRSENINFNGQNSICACKTAKLCLKSWPHLHMYIHTSHKAHMVMMPLHYSVPSQGHRGWGHSPSNCRVSVTLLSSTRPGQRCPQRCNGPDLLICVACSHFWYKYSNITLLPWVTLKHQCGGVGEINTCTTQHTADRSLIDYRFIDIDGNFQYRFCPVWQVRNVRAYFRYRRSFLRSLSDR